MRLLTCLAGATALAALLTHESHGDANVMSIGYDGFNDPGMAGGSSQAKRDDDIGNDVGHVTSIGNGTDLTGSGGATLGTDDPRAATALSTSTHAELTSIAADDRLSGA